MRRLSAFVLLALATPLGAHPHIFVDTGFEIITDDAGHVTHLRVTWAYDALYSLLVTEDLGLDQDGDAVLTPEEEARLAGFDAQWVAGYNGDLVASVDGAPLTLGPPTDATAVMREGRIVSTHLRAVDERPSLAGGQLVLTPYDATFYTAYDVTQAIEVTGLDGCEITREEPDIDAEMARLQAMLSELGRDQDAVEMGFPEVGEAFATRVEVTCVAS